jgi:hypothetical protein
MSSSGPASAAVRERLDAFGQRGSRDGERVDAIGLAALATRPPRVGHQPRWHPDDAFAASDQKPFEGARDVAAVLQRPDTLDAQSPRPLQHLVESAGPDRRRLVTEHLARRRRDTGDGVRALVHVRTEHDHRCVPFCSWLKWTAGGHGLLRALPRSFQVTPDIPDRRRATQQKEVRRTGPTASKRVSSPPVGTFSSTSDVTDTAKSQQQASKRQPTRGSAGAFAALPLLERRVAQITAGARWWPTSSVRAWRGRWR